jgi:glycosyltransferase involved in cell wall biosynthesis
VSSDLGSSPASPRLTIGLVVYNGERYLRAALNSLLDQTFTDYELLISDNGSTDATEEIARHAASGDARIRYIQHPRNRGLAWNLNYVVGEARGRYFMWAGHDDLHARTFIEHCVAVLEARPDVVYAYGETLLIDERDRVFGREINRFDLTARSPNKRFWEQLIVHGGQNFYGIIRTSVLRAVAPHGTIPWAERVMFAELSLHGRLVLVPGATFFWRRHPDQVTAVWDSRLAFAKVLDPERSAWRRSTPVLMTEYVAGYAAAILRAPLSTGERLRCYARLGRWLIGHLPGLGVADDRASGIEIESDWTGEQAIPPSGASPTGSPDDH